MSSEERELLERIAARLDSLERKVEMLVVPPRAVKPKVAGSLLGCSENTVKGMVRRGEMRTVRVGDRQHIPMSEIVRLTTVATAPKSSPILQPRSKRTKIEPSEMEKVRALVRRKD